MSLRIPSISFVRKNLVLFISLGLAIIVTWGIIDQTNRNRLLEQQAIEKRASIKLLEQQIKKRALDNEFLKSDYYLDLAIREQQGYLLPGESVLVINKEQIKQLRQDYKPHNLGLQEGEEEKQLSTWQEWWQLILNN